MNNNPFSQKNFSMHVTVNEANSFAENFSSIMNMDVPVSISNKEFKEFIMAAYNIAISKALPSNSNEYKQKIEKLELEIDQYAANLDQEKKKNSDLISVCDEQSSNINILKNTIIDREEQIIELESKIKELSENITSNVNEIINNIKDDSDLIVLKLSPAEKSIINAYAENETKRTNKIITPEHLIKGSFFHILKNGPFDTFKRLFSNSQIDEIIKKFKNG